MKSAPGQLLLRALGHLHVLRADPQVRAAESSPVPEEVRIAQGHRHPDQHPGAHFSAELLFFH
jgi:hypothetical protein